MSELKVGKCPNCSTRIAYTEDDSSVMCPSCDNMVNVSELESGARVTREKPVASTGASFAPVIVGFDNPESGVVYLENFFDTYDWKAYQELPELEIAEIADVIENNKVKNGASGQSWYLVFKSLAVPALKKIEGLKALAQEMGDKYDPVDASDSLGLFDNYSKIVASLLANKELLFVKLENAVKYAEKYALDAAKLADIKKELKALSSAYEGIKAIDSIDELPEYVAAQEKAGEAVAKSLSDKGINAKEVYAEALSLYKAGGVARKDALEKFESVRGYKDSIRFIKEINRYFDFNNEMFYFFGKYYIYKKESFALPTLNIADLGKKGKKGKKDAAPADDQPQTTTALALYEVVDGVPSSKAMIRGIEKVIDCYGNKFYYFKANQGIFCFDLITHEETAIDKGPSADYKDGNEYQIVTAVNHTQIIVKKKLHPVDKKGCMANFKKKKKDEDKLLNNFCLISIDLATGACNKIIDELVDIADFYTTEVFYIYAERIAKPKAKFSLGKKKQESLEPEKDFNTILMVCDLVTGEKKRVLNEGCEIHTVRDKKIVYSLWKPNAKNIDIRVFDMNTGSDVLIEDNAYSFYGVFKNRIYLTIGNSDYRPLISNNFEGTDRVEIMQNVERVLGVYGSWLYVKKGYGNNGALIKVSMDGKQRIVLCTQTRKIVKETPTHFYYINAFNELRVVRKDGKGDNLIGQNINWAVVEKDKLFYVRNEKVNATDVRQSLYTMDIDGKNVKKVVFDLNSAINFNEDSLYYYKKESLRFKVTVPVGKGKTEEHYEHHNVSRYFRYDKKTGVSEIVMTLGLPTEKTNSFKAGCFGKKAEGKITYEEAPVLREFKRKGLKAVGAVEKEDEEKKNAPAKAAPVATAPAKKKGVIATIVDKVKSIFKKK